MTTPPPSLTVWDLVRFTATTRDEAHTIDQQSMARSKETPSVSRDDLDEKLAARWNRAVAAMALAETIPAATLAEVAALLVEIDAKMVDLGGHMSPADRDPDRSDFNKAAALVEETRTILANVVPIIVTEAGVDPELINAEHLIARRAVLFGPVAEASR